MSHLLDNPIWNGLQTGNKTLNEGISDICFFSTCVSASAGLRINNVHYLEKLYALVDAGRAVTLFSDQQIPISKKWELHDDRMLFQMVHNGVFRCDATAVNIRSLNYDHISSMLALVKLSKPGAFFEKTIEFGNYKGIFIEDGLVAMAGFRFQPLPYVEISAVCTHPDHLGKGYATIIINDLIADIIAMSHIPYLHVSVKNDKALRLYEKLGFVIRRKMRLYTIIKHEMDKELSTT